MPGIIVIDESPQQFKAMSYLEGLRQYLTTYYISNVLASLSYVALKTVHPICEWFFKEDERCELSWADSQTLIFVGIVLAIKNTKWKKDVNRDYFGTAMAFFKAVNLVLFFRGDWRLFVCYFVFCIVLFIAVPEPLYSGPDHVQLFNGNSLEEELSQNPDVTLLMEFYTVWSPPCQKLAGIFAAISLKYDSKYLKFGKVDLGRNPTIAQRFNIDDSVTSRQLPTLILFKNGREEARRPIKSAGRDVKVAPFYFTKENIMNAFDLNSCREYAKNKLEREEKKSKKEEKKRE